MVHTITNEQMKNLMLNILFKGKRNIKRTYNNILWFIGKKTTVSEQDLKDALDFELQGYTKTGENGENIIFFINKDYTTVDFDATNYKEGIELVHQYLMEKSNWYKTLLKQRNNYGKIN